mmetsp:Transcript_7861/g.25920  ORF Transcript_7861/g.25920 Transcript_7861/m.25920 type:complete len:220 (+) Transcript_7861:324-983(+)
MAAPMSALKTRLPDCASVLFCASRPSDFVPSAHAPVRSRQPRSGRTSTRLRPPGFMPTSASLTPATRLRPASRTGSVSPSRSSSSPYPKEKIVCPSPDRPSRALVPSRITRYRISTASPSATALPPCPTARSRYRSPPRVRSIVSSAPSAALARSRSPSASHSSMLLHLRSFGPVLGGGAEPLTRANAGAGAAAAAPSSDPAAPRSSRRRCNNAAGAGG